MKIVSGEKPLLCVSVGVGTP